MKASRLGILSAIVASSCCVLPVLLVVAGLGSLGIGSLLGRFHWGFIGLALGLLTYAWRVYFKEQGQCRTAHCEMEQGKTTRWALIVASIIVFLFMGFNLYTYASQRPHQRTGAPTKGFTQVAIPVEGMTCFTCELTVESSLKRLTGVQQADAKVTDNAVYVSYDPTRASLDDLIAAINKTGYRATRPKER